MSLSHHYRNYANSDAAADQRENPHYLAETGYGCCVSSDNPNLEYWKTHASRGGRCPTLSMKLEQCCGPAGERCLHTRDSLYDQVNGTNLWFAKK
jgi:hypothetical protein